MDQNRTPLLDAIVEYTSERPAYFKIPGHRYEKGISPRWRQWTGDGIFRFDLTEAEGLDDLHHPEGVIKEAQELTAQVFGAEKSYFLVNGTTCGNEAMILACVKEKEKVLIARNAHKSVLMGLVFSGAVPVYMEPEYDEETGLYGSVLPETVEKALQENPDARAVFLVSPTYYGIASDIRRISHLCHEHGALLLVDEAHGGHLYFGDREGKTGELPEGVITLGADLCAQSMHKVTGSLGQSSLLHVGSQRVDLGKLESALHLVQSTSPSYLLMTSLDAARYELAKNGKKMLEHTWDLARMARERINEIRGICCYGRELNEKKFFGIDTTRLVISGKELGIPGFELADRLYQEFRVGVELSDEKNIVAIVTYANEREDIERLIGALEKIAEQAYRDGIHPLKEELPALPAPAPYICSPREAYFGEKKRVLWKDARGKTAGEALVPYPPGIPLINPGEKLTDAIWEYMEIYRKKQLPFHGPSDDTLETFLIMEE